MPHHHCSFEDNAMPLKRSGQPHLIQLLLPYPTTCFTCITSSIFATLTFLQIPKCTLILGISGLLHMFFLLLIILSSWSYSPPSYELSVRTQLKVTYLAKPSYNLNIYPHTTSCTFLLKWSQCWVINMLCDYSISVYLAH